MEQLTIENMHKMVPLFAGCNEATVLSCLQGYMGNAWCDDVENPKSVQLITGDFCYFVGTPNTELVKNIPESYSNSTIFMIPQTKEWEELITEVYSKNYHKFMRYALKKEDTKFDEENLYRYINKLPKEYKIKQIDETVYNKVKSEEWSKDLVSQFTSYNAYAKYGLGFVVIYHDDIVCGASSYTVYNGGIEIEIDTKDTHRRKGLAIACGAKLILECQNRNIYPNWDAAHKGSLSLAEKLGYHFEKAYVTYAITNFR